ncbi:hypothetical protein OIO90_001100 [Microbotryomycetes sp. JL221]|nr:hypothetical protein OIO90_001100 [Microbotryomycetes sp. JL221]
MRSFSLLAVGALALAAEFAAANPGTGAHDMTPLDSRRIVRRAKCHRRSEYANEASKSPRVKVAAVKTTAPATQKEQPGPTTKAEPNPTTTTTSKQEQTTSKPSSGGGGGGSSDNGSTSGGKGLIGYSDSRCGASGATSDSTDSTGPNGSESFLNCGMSKSSPDGEWSPPYLSLDQLSFKSLDEAISMDNSAFSPCAPLVSKFDQIGSETGLPPILLASIAMQESTCNPDITGGGGEVGLMQITPDKCGGTSNCHDVDFNLRTGAQYLKKTLDDNGGDFLKSMGMYNGWYVGLSYNKATAIRGSCWSCQQNMDYLHQMVNGWFQGIEGYKMGTIRNLDK